MTKCLCCLDIGTFKDTIETMTEESQFQQNTIESHFDEMTLINSTNEERLLEVHTLSLIMCVM